LYQDHACSCIATTVEYSQNNRNTEEATMNQTQPSEPEPHARSTVTVTTIP